MSLPDWMSEGDDRGACHRQHLENCRLVSGSRGLTHQDELVVGQLAGPVGFGAVPLKESLCAVDLVLILPSG